MSVHRDERGIIRDLFEKVDAITHIYTVAGAVRGNHVHAKTNQYTLILRGRLLMAGGGRSYEVGPCEWTAQPAGIPHAWKALEDTECLVVTQGPRSGEGYESDTQRLDTPLLT
jgi:quercetin dioxygenase-like cupin family protein